MATQLPRRRVIRTLAGTGTLALLAGCSSGGDGGDGADDGTAGDGGDATDGGGGDGDEAETDTPRATPTPTPRAETVRVGPDARNVFEPDGLEIPAGTTVTFVWASSGHSLVVDSQPDGADWSGVADTQSEGFEHSHTFAVPGASDYYCEPHRPFGMEGSVTVTE